jgi:hypothetical protein
MSFGLIKLHNGTSDIAVIYSANVVIHYLNSLNTNFTWSDNLNVILTAHFSTLSEDEDIAIYYILLL